MRLSFFARQRRFSWMTFRAMADERISPGSVIRCRSKKERHARVRATPLDLRAWRANAGVNATRSIKVESLHPGTLLITRGAHSPRPAVSLPLIAADILPPSLFLPRSSESRPYYETVHAIQRASPSLQVGFYNINKFARCSQMRAATFAVQRRRRQRRRRSFIKRRRLWWS